MRILAIRGKNLASLAGEFELALEQPPLAHAGLFVITGHTGAGKSTLLDALCLALFDRMPRLPTAHGVAIGRADEDEKSRIKSNDVGSILRRGSGSGFAEVDFRASDGRQYRSRWEVRRARGKAAGRLQPQTLTLTDLLSGEVIGDRKGETLKAISERLGLTFDQFRRSVLLAQGDFAAFLKATANERSSLLERITGTDLYTKLSMAAYERAASETTELRELEHRLEGVVPLGEEERALLEREQLRLEQEQKRQLEETRRLQGALEWYLQSTVLEVEVKKGEADLEQATLTWDGAAQRLDALHQVERCQALRSSFDACQRVESELLEANSQVAGTEQTAATGKEERERADKRLKQFGGELLAAEEAQQQALPELAQSHRLDTRIEAQAVMLAARVSEYQSAEAGYGEAKQALNQQQQALEKQQRQQQEADAWLTSHKAYASLAGEWGRWEAELQRYGVLSSSKQKADSEYKQLLALTAVGDSTLDQQRQTHQQAEETLQQTWVAVKALERQRSAYSFESLQSERESLELQQQGVRQGKELIQRNLNVRQQLQETRDGLERAGQASRHHQKQAEDAACRLDTMGHSLDEVKGARDIAALAQGEHAQSLRAMLKEGAHCPVCGATEHPWASLERSFDQQLASLDRRLSELEAERDGLINQQAVSRSEQQQSEAAADQHQRSIAGADTELQVADQAWLALVFIGKPESGLNDVASKETLERLSHTIEQQLKVAREHERKGIALQRESDAKRQEVEQRQREERDALNRLNRMEADLRQQRERENHLGERGNALQQQQETLLALLAAPLEEIDQWQTQLTADPDAFVEMSLREVDLWLQQNQVHKELVERIRQNESELATTAVKYQHSEAQLQRCDKAMAIEQGLLDTLQRERGLLFGGEPAVDVENRLSKRVTQARQRRDEAEQRHNALVAQLAGLDEAVTHWQQEVRRRQEQQRRLDSELEQGLNRRQLTRERLKQLLSRDIEWLAGEQRAIAALKDELERCRTVLSERQQRFSAHQQNQPQAAQEQLAATVERINSELEETRQRLVSTLAEIKQDNEKRHSSAELQQQLQQQRQQWDLWAGLSDLIGSHDGKKFRTFAQSLTLDSLLGYANAHLLDLARRYHLERVPGSDLELQVIDTDMGDEVRSVHSLSGGESFLVSLALALGLASLSSNTAQVESLFIDEGFGSLDQETLDIAIASLDTLQSLGRKVGVISHVPMLVERIGVRVAVEKLGGGKSRVTTVAV
ncbi:MAG: AAA family ATPase [Sedimenticola sp.]